MAPRLPMSILKCYRATTLKFGPVAGIYDLGEQRESGKEVIVLPRNNGKSPAKTIGYYVTSAKGCLYFEQPSSPSYTESEGHSLYFKLHLKTPEGYLPADSLPDMTNIHFNEPDQGYRLSDYPGTFPALLGGKTFALSNNVPHTEILPVKLPEKTGATDLFLEFLARELDKRATAGAEKDVQRGCRDVPSERIKKALANAPSPETEAAPKREMAAEPTKQPEVVPPVPPVNSDGPPPLTLPRPNEEDK